MINCRLSFKSLLACGNETGSSEQEVEMARLAICFPSSPSEKVSIIHLERSSLLSDSIGRVAVATDGRSGALAA